jgi:quercetin dioxygenase-like cupin family protein
MEKRAMVVKSGRAPALQVLGAQCRFLCEASDTGNAWSLMEVQLPRDAGPPPHTHAWDEAYYVVDGVVRFNLGGESQLVSAGDFIYAPAHQLHGFSGASDQPARMLVFDAPAHAGAFFKEVDSVVKDLPEDLAKVPEIGARHGIHFAPRS